MSHFTVMVIGNDYEAQLAPYHEFECTGHVDEYVQDVDITDEFLQEMDRASENADEGESPLDYALGYYGYDNRVVSDESEVDREDTHKYGFVVVKDGNVVKVVRRTNPNAKWDWYTVGGRWTGFLKLKAGAKGELGRPGVFGNRAEPGTADQVLKGDVDWEGMRQEAADSAADQWDRVRKAVPMLWESWDTIRARYPDDISAARDAYHNQEGRKLLWQCKDDDGIRWSEDGVLVPRETFVKNARDSAIVPFAVLKDGNWMERGQMGWFGCVSNEGDRDEWNARVSQMIDELPDDTLITMVDCHI